MPALETIKKITEKATGWGRPAPDDLHRLLRARKPRIFRFKDDGIIPNHPRWPLVLYRGALRRDDGFDP
ncbi:MAG: cupin, partial [Alphaproteobacteria bacterium]